ncbi:hypothetical protein D554_2556 [Bordetella holmesii 30539]|uniref:N-acetyltransferase YedL n=1 Tax=Bordetella holmesii 1058 TaxID=1247648 RepID=A0ABP3BHU7_9BORD|nr:hypothetical protein D558_2601 [Bordetella holmesii 44057]EWM47845.1 hypothetical protein D555_2636 [Bordetella holmesii 35009]EXF87301.1 hypothetical protein D554_2556 [Bordetella holmesii 30539]EXX93305.1 hypothetical protein D559_0692 [Bordetella holmesii 1058]
MMLSNSRRKRQTIAKDCLQAIQAGSGYGTAQGFRVQRCVHGK